VGFYRGKDLMFASRVRAGFVPATRRVVFAKITGLRIVKCPFANLPEKEPGRAFLISPGTMGRNF
jgi:hypothetical protein